MGWENTGVAGWTLNDAATWLDPPISAETLGLLVRAARLNPIGNRRPPRGSNGGRPAAVYEIRELQELHAAFVPWLLRGERG